MQSILFKNFHAALHATIYLIIFYESQWKEPGVKKLFRVIFNKSIPPLV